MTRRSIVMDVVMVVVAVMNSMVGRRGRGGLGRFRVCGDGTKSNDEEADSE